MPQYVPVDSLYHQCIAFVYKHLYEFVSRLEDEQLTSVIEKNLFLKTRNEFMRQHLSTNVIDDILAFRDQKAHYMESNSMRSYYFWKLMLHQRVRYFEAQNAHLSTAFWSNLFEDTFQHLRVLNLSMNCTDDLLAIIPEHCPNLVALNATSKYVDSGRQAGHAASFNSLVSDHGLRHLVRCRHLREIMLNDPRSQRYTDERTITFTGLRRMLRDVPTLQDFHYSDGGSVLGDTFADVEHLNLKAIRLYHTTPAVLEEVFRLCPFLELFVLRIIQHNTDISTELLDNMPPTVHTFEVSNLRLDSSFEPFFRRIGTTLTQLAIKNRYTSIRLEHVMSIARCCPHLTHLSLMLCTTTNVDRKRFCISNNKPPNIGQFYQLQHLTLGSINTDPELMLRFCVLNATDLSHIRLCDSERSDGYFNVERIFLDHINTPHLTHLHISGDLQIGSMDAVRQIVEKYGRLSYLLATCVDDCTQLLDEMEQMNYKVQCMLAMRRPVALVP